MLFGGALVTAGEWLYGRARAVRTLYMMLAAVYAVLWFVAARRLLPETGQGAKFLKEAGVVPEWVELRKKIAESITWLHGQPPRGC